MIKLNSLLNSINCLKRQRGLNDYSKLINYGTQYYVSIRHQYNDNQFKLDKTNSLDYLNNKFNQFQLSIQGPLISRVVLLTNWKYILSREQINKTNDLLIRINNDKIYKQVYDYLLNSFHLLDNHEFTNIYKIYGNIELVREDGKGLVGVNENNFGLSRMHVRMINDLSTRVNEFDINDLSNINTWYL